MLIRAAGLGTFMLCFYYFSLIGYIYKSSFNLDLSPRNITHSSLGSWLFCETVALRTVVIKRSGVRMDPSGDYLILYAKIYYLLLSRFPMYPNILPIWFTNRTVLHSGHKAPWVTCVVAQTNTGAVGTLRTVRGTHASRHWYIAIGKWCRSHLHWRSYEQKATQTSGKATEACQYSRSSIIRWAYQRTHGETYEAWWLARKRGRSGLQIGVEGMSTDAHSIKVSL